ncbi:hypothetical protein [Nocardioides dilutus]
MGDETLPTQDADALGEMPDAETEPREPNPGGADALPQEDDVTAADLDPDKNPAVEPAAPAVLKEGEDTDTEATKDGEDVAPEDESPA